MRKRTFSSKLVLFLGTAAILGFSACTDNDYDFNEPKIRNYHPIHD